MASHPLQNRLLRALPPRERERLLPQLSLVSLLPGATLHEQAEVLSHLYFPIDSIVSLLRVMKDGATAQLALAGNEGVVGIGLFLGQPAATSRAVVQSAGHAYRLERSRLREELSLEGGLRALLQEYTGRLLAQISQTAACTRHHSVHQQFCRWLLMSLDRLPGSELVMTQELLATTLGVRRERLTEAASRLQAAGLIRYSRGRITVLDRPRLEQASCECYGSNQGSSAPHLCAAAI